MINLNLKNIEYVQSLAKVVAQDTKENQAIYKTVTGRHITYGFMSEREYGSGAVAIVRYAPEVKRGNVLSDNGIGGIGITDSTAKAGKYKSGKAKPKAE